MAIISVRELFVQRWTRRGIDGREHQRAYEVITDGPSNGSYSVSTASGIPLLGDAHPEDSDSFVDDVRADPMRDQPHIWTVLIHYAPNRYIVPTDRPEDYWWEFPEIEVPMEYDVDGKAVLNSAGMQFDPPIMMPLSVPTYVVERYEPNSKITPDFLKLYNNCTNAEPYKGAQPGMARCRVSARHIYDQYLNEYWHVHYEIAFHPFHWDPKVLNAGYHELVGNPPKLVKILDSYGREPSHPWPLDVAGKAITNPTPDNIWWANYRRYPRRAFTPLNLP